MPDYANGFVYYFFDVAKMDIVYVGASTQPPKDRKSHHKTDMKKNNRPWHQYLRKVGWDAVEFRVIEKYSCASRLELNMREQWHLDKVRTEQVTPVFNKIRAYTSLADVRENNRKYQCVYGKTEKERARKRAYDKSERGRANKRAYSKTEKCREAGRAYRQSERGKAKAKRKLVKVLCPLCSAKICKCTMKRHQRTKKCQKIQNERALLKDDNGLKDKKDGEKL